MIIEIVRPGNAYAWPKDILEFEGILKSVVVEEKNIIIYLKEE